MINVLVPHNQMDAGSTIMNKICCIGEFKALDVAQTVCKPLRGQELGGLITMSEFVDKDIYWGRLVRQLEPTFLPHGVLHKAIYEFNSDGFQWQYRFRAKRQKELAQFVFTVTVLVLSSDSPQSIATIKHPSVLETWFQNDLFYPVSNFDSPQFRLTWGKSTAGAGAKPPVVSHSNILTQFQPIVVTATLDNPTPLLLSQSTDNSTPSVREATAFSGSKGMMLNEQAVFGSTVAAIPPVSETKKFSIPPEGEVLSQATLLDVEIALGSQSTQDTAKLPEAEISNESSSKSNITPASWLRAAASSGDAIAGAILADAVGDDTNGLSVLNNIVSSAPIFPASRELPLLEWLESRRHSTQLLMETINKDKTGRKNGESISMFDFGFQYEIPQVYRDCTYTFYSLFEDLMGLSSSTINSSRKKGGRRKSKATAAEASGSLDGDVNASDAHAMKSSTDEEVHQEETARQEETRQLMKDFLRTRLQFPIALETSVLHYFYESIMHAQQQKQDSEATLASGIVEGATEVSNSREGSTTSLSEEAAAPPPVARKRGRPPTRKPLPAIDQSSSNLPQPGPDTTENTAMDIQASHEQFDELSSDPIVASNEALSVESHVLDPVQSSTMDVDEMVLTESDANVMEPAVVTELDDVVNELVPHPMQLLRALSEVHPNTAAEAAQVDHRIESTSSAVMLLAMVADFFSNNYYDEYVRENGEGKSEVEPMKTTTVRKGTAATASLHDEASAGSGAGSGSLTILSSVTSASSSMSHTSHPNLLTKTATIHDSLSPIRSTAITTSGSSSGKGRLPQEDTMAKALDTSSLLKKRSFNESLLAVASARSNSASNPSSSSVSAGVLNYGLHLSSAATTIGSEVLKVVNKTALVDAPNLSSSAVGSVGHAPSSLPPSDELIVSEADQQPTSKRKRGRPSVSKAKAV